MQLGRGTRSALPITRLIPTAMPKSWWSMVITGSVYLQRDTFIPERSSFRINSWKSHSTETLKRFSPYPVELLICLTYRECWWVKFCLVNLKSPRWLGDECVGCPEHITMRSDANAAFKGNLGNDYCWHSPFMLDGDYGTLFYCYFVIVHRGVVQSWAK